MTTAVARATTFVAARSRAHGPTAALWHAVEVHRHPSEVDGACELTLCGSLARVTRRAGLARRRARRLRLLRRPLPLTAPRPRQRPVKTAGRLARNASTASRWSALVPSGVCSRASRASVSSSESVAAVASTVFTAR